MRKGTDMEQYWRGLNDFCYGQLTRWCRRRMVVEFDLLLSLARLARPSPRRLARKLRRLPNSQPLLWRRTGWATPKRVMSALDAENLLDDITTALQEIVMDKLERTSSRK